jgi:hypothetical protein
MSLPGLPKSFRPKEVIEESEEETLVGLPASFRKSKKVSDKDKLKDIGQQVFKKGTAGALSAYGNLLDLIHAQTKERQTPAQEALTQAEFEAPESLLPFLQDDDILPRYSRLPSQREAETFIEMLGGPREAKTEAGRIAGRGAEFVGGALPLGAGSKLLQLLAAVGMGGQLTRELGGPEALATGIELLPLAQAGVNIAQAARGPKVPLTKPSGMPVRKFEKLKKQTPVFEGTVTKAKEAIEGDFRKLTEDLLRKTNKSYVALSENPEFKQQIGELFGKVKQAAGEFPEAITPRGMAESLTKEIETIGKRGISLSDSEKVQRSLLKKFRKDIVNKRVTAEQLVDQYRKNNEQLSKLYPYGERALENIGKRNALETYNRAIAEAIEDHFPKSEFSDLFKFTNKRWSEIKKIETIDKYLDALFGKKNINFKQAEKVFTDPKRAERLKNAIGPEVFDDFKQINKDLLSQENALKLLNAKGIDVNKIGKYALSYMVKPKFAATQAAIDLGSKIYRHALYRPEYMREWRKALSRLRKGDVQQALVMIDRLHEKLTDSSDLPKATQ